ncbi:hypothetical protein PoB_003477900 [Plakobranchus ocellatus]|uniref:Uncharacterized protein n=1 Tax=Plakobranchus ocellatus TaxID=259542 RepID=A0AAV4APP5_9GAST|nr:hypothetical protein PoB_003477900 [Plakobranchus ocellatus]
MDMLGNIDDNNSHQHRFLMPLLGTKTNSDDDSREENGNVDDSYSVRLSGFSQTSNRKIPADLRASSSPTVPPSLETNGCAVADD